MIFILHTTAPTVFYTLSLHDALPILVLGLGYDGVWFGIFVTVMCTIGLISPPTGMTVFVIQAQHPDIPDRKSTRLNSSHSQNSYAVFCLKKKKIQRTELGNGKTVHSD